jgi:glycosyltransferase involved in cell wall biosynthesis
VVSGAERQAYLTAKALLKRNVEVSVLTRRYAGLPSFERVEGIPVYRLAAPGNRMAASLSFTVASLLWLAGNRENWTILHGFQLLSPTTIAVLAKLILGGRVVARMACSSAGGTRFGDVNRIRQAPMTALRRHLLGYVDVFVVLNEEGRRDLAEFGLGERPVRLIPNGVDTELFCPYPRSRLAAKRRGLGLPVEGTIGVFVGRLSESKGLDRLLAAWRGVIRDSRKAAYLVIIGSGTLGPRLEAWANGLGKNVRFLGTRDHVQDYLQAADLFVLPSLAEGMSNALLEAMACGLPVVATDVGGSGEVIESSMNGIVVPPDDVDALHTAISYLIHHPAQARELGQAARQTIVARYSVDAIVDQYLALYASVMASEEAP